MNINSFNISLFYLKIYFSKILKFYLVDVFHYQLLHIKILRPEQLALVSVRAPSFATQRKRTTSQTRRTFSNIMNEREVSTSRKGNSRTIIRTRDGGTPARDAVFPTGT